jgi:O-antigen ligase
MNDAFAFRRPIPILLSIFVGLCAATVALPHGTNLALLLTLSLMLLAAVWWLLVSPSRWIAVFLFTALLLPPLPVELGNSGPHLGVAVAAFGVFIGIARLSEWRISFDPVSASLLLFFAVLLASVGCAAAFSGLEIAAGSLVRVLLLGVTVYLFFYSLHGPGSSDTGDSFAQFRPIYWIAVVSALFACVDFYYQFPAPAGYGPQFVWLDSGVYRRAQGVFYEASTLGNLCAFFLVIIVVAMFRAKDAVPLSRPALLFGAAVFTTALVFSYSRGSVVNVIVALAALLYVRRVRIDLKRALVVILSSLVAGAAIVYWVFPSFAEAYWIRLSNSVGFFVPATEGVLSGRVASWRILGTFLMEHPWHLLLGVGYKTLPYSEFIGQITTPDNMYLGLLVETGILGLGAVLILCAAILRESLKAARSPDSRTSFFGTAIFCFWTGQMVQMLSGDLLTYWRVLPLYFWVLATALRR